MRMDLIQPFINAADAVLAETLRAPVTIADVTMEENEYRRRGIAASIAIVGDIEGRVIFDVDSSTALNIGAYLSGGEVDDSDNMICETVCELANMVIGNAVTSLNDQGFEFKILPPEVHQLDTGFGSTEDAEALVLDFRTAKGSLYMNIVMRHNRKRKHDVEMVTH